MLPQFHRQYVKPHDTYVYCIGWMAQNYIHEICRTSGKYTHTHTHRQSKFFLKIFINKIE